MEERRLLFAVALSLVILTGYSLLFGPRPAPSPAPAETPTTEPQPTMAPAPPSEVARETQPPPEEAAEAQTETEVRAVAASEELRVEVEGETRSIAFTNRGARLLSWTLADYRDARGRPEEMVPAATSNVRPLDVETGEEAIDDRLREALFVPSTQTLRVSGSSPGTLVFRYSGGGIEAAKSFTFEPGGLVTISASVRSGGEVLPTRLVWGPGIGNPSEEEREVRGYQEPEGVALTGGEVERFQPKKLSPAGESLARVRWAGVESRYFTALMIPRDGLASAEIRAVTQPGSEEAEPQVAAATLVDIGADAPLKLYVGAKDYEALKKLGFGLQRVVPVGDWLGPLVVPLMRLLQWVQRYVGNWGWAIVILTILINVVMAPLRHYSIVNGMKMAKMQPEMKVIQERYRKVPMMDPRRQKMQEEMGELYARHGMSMGTQMLVGCLPLLLTMPFLFAFYRMLSISVELRGAPFLWIPDLSQKDPLFVTPVLMGVSMYAMQKMTPSTLDPSQQRIMMLMPVMLAGMFLWAPAGLNLYWLTANIWSLMQQTVEMRVLKAREPALVPKKERKKERKKR
jgi:YidC/Oxa1 family membrane protein insertase